MRNRTCGFTVIELLAAIAIVGMLMVAVMQVLGSLGRTSKIVEQQVFEGETWVADFVSVLERDMAHASDVSFNQSVLQVKTLGVYDPDTLAWRYLPSRINYRMIRSHGVSVLIREQVLQLEGEADRKLKQIVAAGVEVWDVKRVEGGGGDSNERLVLMMRMVDDEEVVELPLAAAMRGGR